MDVIADGQIDQETTQEETVATENEAPTQGPGEGLETTEAAKPTVMVSYMASKVAVYKVFADTIEQAFHIFKTQYSFDNINLEVLRDTPPTMHAGYILKKSKTLHHQYINNAISQMSVFGALYNNAPKVKDTERIIKHNIVSRGTKKWETVNSYQTDSGEVLAIDTGTKADSMLRAEELAMEFSTTVNIVLSKRLTDHEGILGVVEYFKATNVDDKNVYIFWKYEVNTSTIPEDEAIDESTVEEANGQLAIEVDMYTYHANLRIKKEWVVQRAISKEEEKQLVN